jgi:hypothetical protein
MLGAMDIAELDLARADIPDGPCLLVDVRRMVDATTGNRREPDGGHTWFVDLNQPEDLKVAIHEAKIEARKRGLSCIYVRGRNA